MASGLLTFFGSVRRHPAVDAWFDGRSGELGGIARCWFARIRECGIDVRELVHDGCPTACVDDAPFAYTNVFKSHVNVGFFHGNALPDPTGLLQGAGKFMRHVTLKPGLAADESSLEALIRSAYRDIKLRLVTQPPEELEQITAATLDHYNARAAEFWNGTRDHDVGQNIDALLRHIHGTAPFDILDFGCGPGRDLATFRALGHLPVGLEGSTSFAGMAREHSGCEVWEQNFLSLALPAKRFHGIFANASLFHIPRQELPRVLRELHAALRQDGVLFTSNPRGNNEEGWNRGRYGAYHDLESWREFLTAAHFSELEHYYRPAGLPREEQPWLASVWRRNDE